MSNNAPFFVKHEATVRAVGESVQGGSSFRSTQYTHDTTPRKRSYQEAGLGQHHQQTQQRRVYREYDTQPQHQVQTNVFCDVGYDGQKDAGVQRSTGSEPQYHQTHTNYQQVVRNLGFDSGYQHSSANSGQSQTYVLPPNEFSKKSRSSSISGLPSQLPTLDLSVGSECDNQGPPAQFAKQQHSGGGVVRRRDSSSVDESRGGKRAKKSKDAKFGDRNTPSSPAQPKSAPTSRADTSLSVLTKKFLEFLLQQPNRQVDLNLAVTSLGYAKRRLYDVTNVLEGVGVVEKTTKNTVRWAVPVAGTGDGGNAERKSNASQAAGSRSAGGGRQVTQRRRKSVAVEQCSIETAEEQTLKLEEQLQSINREEYELNEIIRQQEIELKHLTEDAIKQRYAYVSSTDLRSASGLNEKILLCIKAPEGTKIEVLPTNSNTNLDLTLSSNSKPIKVFVVKNDRLNDPHDSSQDRTLTERDANSGSGGFGGNGTNGGNGPPSQEPEKENRGQPPGTRRKAQTKLDFGQSGGCGGSGGVGGGTSSRVLMEVHDNFDGNPFQESDLNHLGRRYASIFQSPDKHSMAPNDMIQTYESDSTNPHENSMNQLFNDNYFFSMTEHEGLADLFTDLGDFDT